MLMLGNPGWNLCFSPWTGAGMPPIFRVSWLLGHGLIQWLLKYIWNLGVSQECPPNQAFPLRASAMSSDCLWSGRNSSREIWPALTTIFFAQNCQEKVFCSKSVWWKVPFAGFTLRHEWGTSTTSSVWQFTSAFSTGNVYVTLHWT